jgi:hypothetical protein
VSEQTGLSVDAMRFYEKQPLLERPRRTEGGFRLGSARKTFNESNSFAALSGSDFLFLKSVNCW